MTNKTKVYWKRKEGNDEEMYISGWCSEDDVPSYGEVKSCPLPKEVEVTTREDGTLVAKSPLIFGARKAYCYRLCLSPQFRENIAEESDFSLELKLDVMCAEGPSAKSSRENWWWYAKDNFRSVSIYKPAPISLAKKWKRAMLEILLETHPDKDKKLAKWDEQLESYKKYQKSKSEKRTPSHKKADGDIVVLPYPLAFSSGNIKQIYKYSIEDAGINRRKKHTLVISGVTYKTPHGSAMTFKDGTAPCNELSLPIRISMALVAWANAPLESAHEVLSARAKFEPLLDGLLEEFEKTDASKMEDIMKQKHELDIAAALSALKDFFPRADDFCDHPRKCKEITMISEKMKPIKSLFEIRSKSDTPVE